MKIKHVRAIVCMCVHVCICKWTYTDDVHSILAGNQEEGSVEPTPVIGTIRITNLGPEATVEKLGELFGSLGKIKVHTTLLQLLSNYVSFFPD